VPAADLATVVDLDRYPVDPLRSEFVTQCHVQLADEGALRLEGFLRPEAVARMVEQAQQAAAKAHPNDARHNAYFTDVDESLPADDPRRILVRSAQRAVAMEDLPEDFGARVVYDSDEVLRFCAAVLGAEELYRSADPLDGCNMTVYAEGDELGWHFDQSEFSVTLMIQRADRGGDFEYAPMVRTPDDERYDDVRSVLLGDRERVKLLASEPGTLAFFRGRYSLHRVPPVEGATPRMNSVLTYAREPGHKLSPMAQRMYYGRTA
jgi:hypothetical protein